MVNAKNAFKENNYIEHPFGTSEVGLLCESLNNLFKNKQDDKIQQWLKENSISIAKQPLITPILPLILCASFAKTGEQDQAGRLLDICFENRQIFHNFEDGHERSQNKAKAAISYIILDHLQPNLKRKVDLFARAMFEGQDPFLIKDIVKKTKKTHLQDHGFKIAFAAHRNFPKDNFVAQAVIDLCKPDKKIKWLKYFCEKFPDDSFMHNDLAHRYIKEGQAKKAFDLLSDHIKQYGNDRAIKTTLSIAEQNLGKTLNLLRRTKS